MTNGIHGPWVVEWSYRYPHSEMWGDALKDMLRYEGEGSTVISDDRDNGVLTVQLPILHARRWQSFGYRLVKVVEATGDDSEDFTWLFS